MAYEPRNGSFTLFKNKYKKNDNHPEYRGTGLDMNGNKIKVSAWVKTGNSGETFMSCAIEEDNYVQPEQTGASSNADDLPF